MSSLENESQILEHFKDLPNNPKKIKKLAMKLHNESNSDLQRMLCMDIINAPKPKAYIDFCVRRIEEFAMIMEEEIAKGNHGVLFVGKKGDIVYPIRLNTVERWLHEKEQWTAEDEFEIQKDSVKIFMESMGSKHLLAKVVLFPQFGFSGIPRMIEMNL